MLTRLLKQVLIENKRKRIETDYIEQVLTALNLFNADITFKEVLREKKTNRNTDSSSNSLQDNVLYDFALYGVSSEGGS